MKQIVCMKWGTLYDSDYVNKLYGMVRHFTTGDIRFICLTDDSTGIRKEVECLPVPPHPILNNGQPTEYCRKITLLRESEHLSGIKGEFVFLDLDVVITSNIDELFTYEADKSFVVMLNATQRGQGIGNTSCYRLVVGAHSYIYDDILESEAELRKKYWNEQICISKTIKEIAFYPEEWCMLFKVHCVHPLPLRYFMEPRLPKTAKVVAFPGFPNPTEAAMGIWKEKEHKKKRWDKKIYKYIRPTKWISDIYKLCNV